MAISVLIVDDHHVVREGLRTILKRVSEVEVVDEAVDGAEAIEKARHLRPNVVLMDLFLPGVNGVAATAAIREELPETQVVILTGMLENSLLAGAVRAGAIGYLFKDAQVSELRTAIKAAAAGQMHLSSQAATALLYELRVPDCLERLTEREMEVLDLLSKGYANKEIAHSLYVSEDTVKTHVRHILSKLGVQSRTQAILAAIRLGLVARNPETAVLCQ
jgi:two-component system, NarL family, response regulator LiaR